MKNHPVTSSPVYLNPINHKCKSANSRSPQKINTREELFYYKEVSQLAVKGNVDHYKEVSVSCCLITL